MLWYRFEGPAHVIIHASQICAGIILSLLGLLNIGPQTADFLQVEQSDFLATVNPMHQLSLSSLPLVVVMLVYLCTFLGSTLALVYVHRRRGDIYETDDEKETSGEASLEDRTA
jgi:hypothetical protein